MISELYTNITAGFDWLKYINKVLEIGKPNPVSVDMNEKIVVYATGYLVDFFNMLPTKPEYTYE